MKKIKYITRTITLGVVLISLMRFGCGGPISLEVEDFIGDTDAFDEIILDGSYNDPKCIFNLIRREYPKYRTDLGMDKSIIHAFKNVRKTESTFLTNWYLVEVVTIDLRIPNNPIIQVRFFEAAEGRIQKIKRTNKSDETIIQSLSEKCKICRNGV